MEDFKDGVTLSEKEADAAAIKLAGIFVELLKKLDQKTIGGEVPAFS